MIIMGDEWFFFAPTVLPAILPTLNNGAVFVMLSSMASDIESPLFQLLSVKYRDGTNVVSVLNWIQACKDCERKGLQDSCTHRVTVPQHFTNFSNQERVGALMSGDKASHDRELKNAVATPSMVAAFEKPWLDRMASRAHRLQRTVNHLFITIDPSAAKERNLYALLSTVFINGECISNLPHIAESLRESLKDEYRVQRAIFMMEDGHGHGKRRVFDLPGSMTTERNKRESVDILRDQYLKEEQICFNEPFINVYPDIRIFSDIKLEIMDHLRNFKKKLLPRRDRSTAEVQEITYTGKLSGSKNDDFVSAILIAVYNKREFWKEANRAKYGAYWGFGEQ